MRAMSPPRRPGRTESDGTPSDLRAALRVATAELHRRLDRAPAQRALLAPDLTLQRYAAILATHAAAYRRCEAMLSAVAEHLPGGLPVYRSRLPALRDDLAWLSTVTNDVEVPTWGRAGTDGHVLGDACAAEDVHDAVRGEGRCLGLRYVLEGATQGATVISARLARHRPELADGPFAFWRLQAAEAPGWPALTEVLAARPADGEGADVALAAATEAFGVFLRAFAPVAASAPAGDFAAAGPNARAERERP